MPSDAPPTPSETEETRTGTVIRSTGSWYEVQTPEGVISSKVRGKFRLADQATTNPIAVGDRVTLLVNADETGFITEIHPRQNRLSRRAAGRRIGREHVIVANIDRAWVVQSVRLPKFNAGFVDRFLVMAEAHGIPAGLIVNKLDLLRPKQIEEIGFWCELYLSLGYPVLEVSATEHDGIDAVREALRDQTSVVAGPSGVGKSTLLNAVEPELGLRTGEISQRTRKGKHTTTNASLYPLSFGGFVVDTPGIREFGIIDLEPAELGACFVEFAPFAPACHFPNCTHDHEPDCAVKLAVDEGAVTLERYESYLTLLYSLQEGGESRGR